MMSCNCHEFEITVRIVACRMNNNMMSVLHTIYNTNRLWCETFMVASSVCYSRKTFEAALVNN